MNSYDCISLPVSLYMQPLRLYFIFSIQKLHNLNFKKCSDYNTMSEAIPSSSPYVALFPALEIHSLAECPVPIPAPSTQHLPLLHLLVLLLLLPQKTFPLLGNSCRIVTVRHPGTFLFLIFSLSLYVWFKA